MNQVTMDIENNDEAEALQARIAALSKLYAVTTARKSLIPFVRFMQPDPDDMENPEASRYKPAMHHNVIAEALENVLNGKCLRLILSVPPQHGKSELATRNFPAMYMGHYPWRHVIVGAYNDDFATKFGSEVREIITDPRYRAVFPNVKLRDGSKAKDLMATTERGDLLFRGRGASITGNPADLFIMDDPIKDAKEAESLTIRNDIWEWFTKVVFSRCHALSAIIIIMTRWHEDDIVGRLTNPRNPHYNAEEAAKWTYINIPAILDDEGLAKALGKEKGEALWPERFPLNHLESARRMNPMGFSALYMGRPTPPEGAFYKRDMLHGYDRSELDGKMFQHYIAGDLAISPEANRDKSCVGVWGIDTDGVFYLLPDLYWERRSSDQSVDRILTYVEQYKPLTFFSEKGQIDKSLRPFLEAKMRERGIWVNVDAMPVAGSKGTRSVAMRGFMASGRVRFPKFAYWWQEAEDELLKFTGSGDDTHDDFCDMIANFGQGISKTVSASREPHKDNVVQIGTMRWVRHASEVEKRRLKMANSRKGF
jgi:predicted phage terminase large subunit-like protein